MKKIQGALVIVSSLLVFGPFSGIAMAQALVEFALSGMWAGIDPQDGSMNQLSITFTPDGSG